MERKFQRFFSAKDRKEWKKWAAFHSLAHAILFHVNLGRKIFNDISWKDAIIKLVWSKRLPIKFMENFEAYFKIKTSMYVNGFYWNCYPTWNIREHTSDMSNGVSDYFVGRVKGKAMKFVFLSSILTMLIQIFDIVEELSHAHDRRLTSPRSPVFTQGYTYISYADQAHKNQRLDKYRSCFSKFLRSLII